MGCTLAPSAQRFRSRQRGLERQFGLPAVSSVCRPASSNANVVQITNASIGDYSDVHLLAPLSGVSLLFVEAYNEAIVHEKVKMDSGGAVAVAEADAITSVTDTATTSFGAHSSSVVDVGDVEAAAWGNADINSISAVTTYGLAGAPVRQSLRGLQREQHAQRRPGRPGRGDGRNRSRRRLHPDKRNRYARGRRLAPSASNRP